MSTGSCLAVKNNQLEFIFHVTIYRICWGVGSRRSDGTGQESHDKKGFGEPTGETSVKKYLLNDKKETSVAKDLLNDKKGFGELPRKSQWQNDKRYKIYFRN